MQTLFAETDEPIDIRPLDDEACARLAGLHHRIAPRLPHIATRIITRTRASSTIDSIDHERLRELLVEWMRSGLVGPYGDTFRILRARVGRRLVECALLHGAVYVTLLALRTEYRRLVDTLYQRDEGRAVLDAVDVLLELELDVMMEFHREQHERRMRFGERDMLAERLEALRTLTAGLAHELRNPLNSAKLQLEVLERRLRRELDDVRFVGPSQLARTEIEKLSDLLDELLAFANPPSLELVRHDLMAVAREVVEGYRTRAAHLGITLALCGPACVLAEIDVAKMRTILQHLLANGVEAVEHDGAIRMIVRAHADRIRIEVVDDGPGISTEVRARIYEPFFSTKGTCTGLGMSIVHSMVALHGGSVDIQSEPGTTAVAISIPRRAR